MWKAVRLLLCFAPVATGAGSAQTDSTVRRPPILRTREAAVAVGLVVTGALFDKTVRDRAQLDRSTTSNDVAQVGNGTGNLLYIGPFLAAGWVVGKISGERSLSDATYRAFQAGAVAGAITGIIKMGVGRVRPRDSQDALVFHPFSQNSSFPSGHTTLAVAIATSLAHSTPDGWSDILFYGAAGVTGFARINDNKHWLSDVVAGSVVGYLVGRQLTRRPTAGATVIAGPGVVGVTLPIRFNSRPARLETAP